MEKRSALAMAAAIKFMPCNIGRKSWFEVTEAGEIVFYTDQPSLFLIPEDAGNWHYSSAEKAFVSNDGLRITVSPCQI